MAAPLTDLELAKQALSLAGGAAITDWAEDERIEPLYRGHTDALLSVVPWRFTIHNKRLSRLLESPDAVWAHAFQLESDALDTPLAFYEQPDTRAGLGEFEIYEDQVRANVPDIWASYPRRPSSPQVWGPLFVEFARTSLAAILALALNEDRSRHDSLMVRALGPRMDMAFPAGLFLATLQRHAMSLPNETFAPDGGPLMAARLGGW